jgi:hypothetical protein
MVEMSIDQSAKLAQQMLTEPAIPADVLVGITDRVAAEELQTVFDALWEEGDGDFKIGENQLYSCIIGWQWLLCEWDDDEHQHVLRNVPFLQVHVDPLCTNLKDAQWVIYDQILSADEASAKYPELEAEIRKKATPGRVPQSGTAYRQASIYNVGFVQEMVGLRTAWIRNQPIPLTPKEAVERGLVEEVTDTLDIPTECTCGVGIDQPVSMHHESCPCREGYEVDPESLAVPDAPAPDPFVGEAVEPVEDPAMRLPVQSRTETFTSYKLVRTGEVVEEGEKGWPSRPVLRQIRIIADTVVDDRECEYVDIPLALNINVPIPFTPYGKGEPQHLEGLQMALNAVLSDLVTHWHNHAQPAEFVPESVNAARPKFAQGMYNHPAGLKSVIPDDIYRQLGNKIGFYMDPPSAPSDGWQLIQLLLKLLDDASENSEVLQGKASASWSGEAISSLQRAAKGVIGWKSRRLEFVLKHVAKVMAGSIIHRMPLEEKMRYARRYPKHVWAYLDQYQKQTLEYDLSVEITSGTGAKKQAEQASDLSLFDRGVLSKTTLLESVGKDAKIERHNQIQEAREDAAAKAQVPQQAPSPPAQGQPQPAEQPPQQPQPAM